MLIWQRKFCDKHLADGIRVDGSRIGIFKRKESLLHVRASSKVVKEARFWSSFGCKVTEEWGGILGRPMDDLNLRVFNNTKECKGEPMVIFQKSMPDIDTVTQGALVHPSEPLLDIDGMVTLIPCYGTLAPSAMVNVSRRRNQVLKEVKGAKQKPVKEATPRGDPKHAAPAEPHILETKPMKRPKHAATAAREHPPEALTGAPKVQEDSSITTAHRLHFDAPGSVPIGRVAHVQPARLACLDAALHAADPADSLQAQVGLCIELYRSAPERLAPLRELVSCLIRERLQASNEQINTGDTCEPSDGAATTAQAAKAEARATAEALSAAAMAPTAALSILKEGESEDAWINEFYGAWGGENKALSGGRSAF